MPSKKSGCRKGGKNTRMGASLTNMKTQSGETQLSIVRHCTWTFSVCVFIPGVGTARGSGQDPPSQPRGVVGALGAALRELLHPVRPEGTRGQGPARPR